MEIWLVYSLIAAVFTALSAIAGKKVLSKEHAMEFSTVLAIIIAILSIPLFFLIDYSKLELIPVLLILFTSILGALGFLLIAKSMRHMEISEVMPLLTLSPAITTFFAFIILDEIPTRLQTLGIIFLIAGAYVIETKKTRLFDPIKLVKESKYIRYIAVALFIYSVAEVLDRIILSKYNMEVNTFIALTNIFLALHFTIMLAVYHDGFKGIKHGFKETGKTLLLVAICVLGYRYAQSAAIKIVNVGLVVATKRISVLLTVIIGGEIFHEKNIIKKSIASLIIIIGAILIAY